MNQTRTTLLASLADRSDQAAWRTFDQLYRPMLVGYVCSRGLSQADAEDVAQQCIEAVLERIDTYPHQGSFRTWLRSIAEKRIADLHRRRRDVQANSAVWQSEPDSHPGPRTVWEQGCSSDRLKQCVEAVRDQVAAGTFAAFVAYAIEERPAASVARDLGMSVSQVYVAKHRVLERVRGMMRSREETDRIKVVA